MNAAAKPTCARLRALFAYDPSSGVLTRRITTSNRCPAGKRAGTLDRSTGYRRVNVDGRLYGEHAVIWCWCTGDWPAGLIDHRNGVRSDNRIDNLRDATRRINQQNLRRARSDNKTGLLGVTVARDGTPQAHIRINGRQTYLGRFPTQEAAHAAYLNAKRDCHEGCTL